MIGDRAEALRVGEIAMRILDHLQDESPESIVARGRFAELLGDVDSLHEAREILESGLERRKKPALAESVFLADARLRLASHLIRHGDSLKDRQIAKQLLRHPSLEVVIGERPAKDYFHVEWLRLREVGSGRDAKSNT